MTDVDCPSSQGVRTIDRAFRVLGAFEQDDDAYLSLADLTSRSGLPKPTVLRLANGLVACGALEHVDDGRYSLGPRLSELSSLARHHDRLSRLALPYMGDLFAATHATIHLAVLDGRSTVIVEKITGRHSVAVASSPGMRVPAYCTGLGKVLLAYSPAESTDRVVSAGLKRRTVHTVASQAHLRRTLDEVRRAGVAYDRGEMAPEIGCVAAPVFGATGEVLGALSVVGPSKEKWLGQVTSAVRAAAAGLTRRAMVSL
ncbi:IclR family transcriptional regulator domain-containing protein [Nocardia sp. R6R-6]|uniref:IclR family transcriptional regulator domain-containing protein n=1 Tax=Nocardia sp. R6R-6 TaxID=3459303 RepID=UPI00403D852D